MARGGFTAFGTHFRRGTDHVGEHDGSERQEREGREGTGKEALHAAMLAHEAVVLSNFP